MQKRGDAGGLVRSAIQEREDYSLLIKLLDGAVFQGSLVEYFRVKDQRTDVVIFASDRQLVVHPKWQTSSRDTHHLYGNHLEIVN